MTKRRRNICYLTCHFLLNSQYSLMKQNLKKKDIYIVWHFYNISSLLFCVVCEGYYIIFKKNVVCFFIFVVEVILKKNEGEEKGHHNLMWVRDGQLLYMYNIYMYINN